MSINCILVFLGDVNILVIKIDINIYFYCDYNIVGGFRKLNVDKLCLLLMLIYREK